MSATQDDEPLPAVVDREQCFGFGYCAEILPDVFVIDASGHATVVASRPDPLLIAEAVAACPRSAISAVDPGTPAHDAERA